jgi:hypothetical protein
LWVCAARLLPFTFISWKASSATKWQTKVFKRLFG